MRYVEPQLCCGKYASCGVPTSFFPSCWCLGLEVEDCNSKCTPSTNKPQRQQQAIPFSFSFSLRVRSTTRRYGIFWNAKSEIRNLLFLFQLTGGADGGGGRESKERAFWRASGACVRAEPANRGEGEKQEGGKNTWISPSHRKRRGGRKNTSPFFEVFYGVWQTKTTKTLLEQEPSSASFKENSFSPKTQNRQTMWKLAAKNVCTDPSKFYFLQRDVND